MNLEEESIYDHIKQVFGAIPTQCNILEEQINVELQHEYFKFGKKIKKQPLEKDKLISQMDNLFQADATLGLKKEMLSKLATIDEVACFRTIEKYLNSPDAELKDWAILALQESRMLIQSKLLDEEQVFISTGMGGKGSKLRYFMVLISQNKRPLTESHLSIVDKEFDFSLKGEGIELEEVFLDNEYIKIILLIPIQTMIKDVIKRAILECNQYGNFLMENFLITNVKRLNNEDIQNLLEDKDDNDNDDTVE